MGFSISFFYFSERLMVVAERQTFSGKDIHVSQTSRAKDSNFRFHERLWNSHERLLKLYERLLKLGERLV